jgi:hypothetical protein
LCVLAACGGDDGTHHVDLSCANSTVYLNRFGGAYTHGAVDDAAQNLSIVVDVARTLPPFPGDDAAWSEITACIRTALSQFDVVVTETDPGTAQHLELVFTDTYWDDPGVTHVFPASCAAHQIELIFGSALSTPTRGCQVAMDGLAQMIAQLGPSENCLDFTSPAMDCGVRSFVSVDEACVDPATDLAAPCRCNAAATTQNSFQALDALFHPCR